MTFDKAANMAVIGLCLVLAGDVAITRLRQTTPDRAGTTTPTREANQRAVYDVGEPFHALTAWQPTPGTHQLYLIVRDGCRFCDASTGFYSRIVAASRERRDLQIVGLCLNPDDVCADYFGRNGVAVHRTVSVGRDRLQIAGTPTLVLVDDRGMVKAVWQGQLKQSAEREVLDAVARRGGSEEGRRRP